MVRVVKYVSLPNSVQRPGSRSSRENMYGGSHDNREKYAYQQNSQIMAKRKKSKTVSQY